LSSRNLLRGSSLLGDTHPVGIHIIHGFHITETDTLGISVTEVALKVLSVNNIKTHRAEWTDRDTRTAANAYVVIHHHPTEFLIAGNGLDRADDHARSVLTLLAGHGNIEPF
jgi:hypothetical protein